jgi:aspartyl aminopeptidase
MALVGVVVKKDGTVVDISIGEKDDDPVVGVSDLLIHLAAEQMKKPGSTVVEGEKLNLLAGSIPAAKEEKEPVKKNLLEFSRLSTALKKMTLSRLKLKLSQPAEARDYGLDRSMIIGYGHDDKVCAYTSLRAIADMKKTFRKELPAAFSSIRKRLAPSAIPACRATTLHMLQQSSWQCREMTLLVDLNDMMENSRMLSSDVSVAYDPNYPDVTEAKNTAYFGMASASISLRVPAARADPMMPMLSMLQRSEKSWMTTAVCSRPVNLVQLMSAAVELLPTSWQTRTWMSLMPALLCRICMRRTKSFPRQMYMKHTVRMLLS